MNIPRTLILTGLLVSTLFAVGACGIDDLPSQTKTTMTPTSSPDPFSTAQPSPKGQASDSEKLMLAIGDLSEYYQKNRSDIYVGAEITGKTGVLRFTTEAPTDVQSRLGDCADIIKVETGYDSTWADVIKASDLVSSRLDNYTSVGPSQTGTLKVGTEKPLTDKQSKILSSIESETGVTITDYRETPATIM